MRYKRTNGAARAESCSYELCRVVTEVDHRSNVLKSKVLISNVSNNSRRGATKAFTERGLYMLATVLKGERARQVTFTIIETFFKVLMNFIQVKSIIMHVISLKNR